MGKGQAKAQVAGGCPELPGDLDAESLTAQLIQTPLSALTGTGPATGKGLPIAGDQDWGWGWRQKFCGCWGWSLQPECLVNPG